MKKHIGIIKNITHKNSLRKKDCEIKLCRFSDIRHIFKEFHYRKEAMGGGISYCFAMFHQGNLVGGSVLGLPRHGNKYKNHIDIRRMALLDSSPKNSESYFLGRIIQFIASNTEFTNVLSYSDKTQGHIGTIYKASNFKNIGETAKSKYVEYEGKEYHMRSLTIERPYSYVLRDAVKNNKAFIKTGEPKIIWVYNILKSQQKKTYNIANIKDKNLVQKTLF